MSFLEIDLRERRDGYTMSELQSHSYYELYFLLEGERSVFYENKMFRVTANAFCVIPPFHMHKTSGGPCRRININVSPDCLDAAEQRFLTQCAEEVAFTLPPQNADFLKKILLSAACADRTEHRRRQTLSPAFVHTLLYMLEKEPLIPLEFRAALSETERDTRILETVSS